MYGDPQIYLQHLYIHQKGDMKIWKQGLQGLLGACPLQGSRGSQGLVLR